MKLIPLDKCYHLIAGMVIFAAFNFFIGSYAIIPVIIIALLKEYWYDATHTGHTVDIKDAVCTIFGGLLVAALFLIL